MSSSGKGNGSSKKEPPAASKPDTSGTMAGSLPRASTDADGGQEMRLSVNKSKKRKSRLEDDVKAENAPSEVSAQTVTRRSSERIKKLLQESSAAGEPPPVTPSKKNPSRKQRKTAATQAATGTKDNLSGFFDPAKWTIMREAHQMVEALVKDENGPYRKKLLDLAKHGIDKTKIRGVDNSRFTPSGVVDEAWAGVRYSWADSSNDLYLTEDGACAYTAMGGESYPLVSISSSFMENDYPVEHTDSPATRDEYTTDDNKTLLLFFRKLKHEFLHVVHRFLAITHKASFPTEKYTLEKYMPNKQHPRRRIAQPEVGDHDEEEDSAGPILPLFFNQKLCSNNNPLCLYYDNKYLELSDEHVEVEHCRAIKARVFDEDFIQGVSIAANHAHSSTTRAVSRSSSTSNSRTSSPGRGLETYDSTEDDDKQPAWRRYGSIPIEVQFPLRFPELSSQTSNNNQRRN